MTHNEMYQAVVENDANYDGVFFYAVKTTGIYCRPSCKSKTPKRDNIRFFETGEHAREAGFKPCKRCRSDLLDYQPMKEIAENVKKVIDDMFDAKKELGDKLRQVGISQHRMIAIFKEQYGVTPAQYANDMRLKQSKKLLTETKDEIADIAYAVGFGSLSAFYRFFKEQVGKSPGVYREEMKNE
ncbi:MAG: bifunctional transcriptional activator/DNA repair enzyme AdaA [Sedimentibacter sp.]